MTCMKQKDVRVDAYIRSAPPWAREILKELRQTILSAEPEVQESISYGMPYYRMSGRVAYIAARRKHCSFHWLSDDDKKQFAKELAKQTVAGSTLHFFEGARVPAALIKKIVSVHVEINTEKRSRVRGGMKRA